MNNEIKITYPRTKYLKLNLVIQEKIQRIISEFMSYAKEPVQEDFTYQLIITTEEYTYQQCLSFVFFVSMYTGGAHPDNRIFTVNYNTRTNEIITIDSLISKNPRLLGHLSENSRSVLSKNPNIQDMEMMRIGTEPNRENFMNFVFTNAGLKIYFPQYQIAPYSSGAFYVTIPYQNLVLTPR